MLTKQTLLSSPKIPHQMDTDFLKADIKGGKTGLKGEFPTSAEVHLFPCMLLKFPHQISFPVPVILDSRLLPLKVTF